MMILGGGAGSAQNQHYLSARSVVVLLLSMNTLVAVSIYFHTIASDVDVRLDAYSCHIGKVTHGMAINDDAASEPKISTITPTRL